MSLRLIYGKSGTGKSEQILKEISNLIENEEKVYIITPEQFSFTLETKLLETIKGESVINAEVLTFNRMAHRVKSEVGGVTKTDLSSYGKSMIIYDILDKSKKELKLLGKSAKNVDIITRLINELKTHWVELKDIEKVIESEQDIYLKSKLQDILCIYKKFEERIKNNFIDENDTLTILANQLPYTNMFENTIIYIDEFVGFTPQEYKVILELLKVAKQVNITICTDSLLESKNKENDIFYTNKKTVSKIINLANNNGIQIENPVYLNKCYRFKNDELKHLEENLYKTPYKKYAGEVKNINLFLSSNPYSEIEHIAGKIVELVRDDGLRYKDISIITKNLDDYASLAKAIFAKYDIPIFIDKKKDLSQDILIKYVLAILEIFARNWDYEAVINYVKLGFCDITDEEIFKVENYARRWGIKYNKWYSKDWTIGEDIVDLNRIRKLIVKPLLNFKNNLEGKKTVKQITRILYQFLIHNNIQEKLTSKAEQLENSEEIKSEYIASWNLLMEILDEIVLIFGDDEISFEKYAQTLKIAFSENNLGAIPASIDQVVIGDVNRSRSKKTKVIFIIGLNDGVFPSTNREEGLINDTDREILKDKGITLAKTTKENIYEENFNIYKAFTTAEQSLYLSYSGSSSDGNALKPSTLIYKIKKIFNNLQEKSDIIKRENIITNKKATFELLLTNLRDFNEGKEISSIWFDVYKIYSNDSEWKEKLEKSIKAQNYTNQPEKITKENLEKMYGDTIFTSISRLEQYRKCPFSFYLKYGLNINEKDTFQIQSIDTGTFMHETIDSFFGKVQDENINIKEITDEKLEKIVKEIIEEKLKLNKNYIFTSSAKFRTLTARLIRVLIKSMKYIVESIRKSDFEILGHEIEFGKVGEYPAIEIKLDDGKKVEITGKIDRVDVLKTEDGQYVRIIDYKSSVKDIDLDEVMAGLQIQLLTYMDAITKIEDFMPAGILYFNLIEPVIKANRNTTDEDIEEQIRKQFKMRGIVLSDINIVKKMDKDLEKGASNIVPVYIDSKGNISGAKSSSANIDEFNKLQEYTIKTLKEISKEIFEGNIDIKPYYKNTKTGCDYCGYKAICGFNTSNNKYNYIKHFEEI
ncbi:MAG: helicase-exonuclease AddAB subunit AddB [Clostridia bacterium]|nr:helicase-exonuclease AddAB subunit AddB [Clostridia bacterium]